MTPDAARALADLRRVANACPDHAATIRAAGRTLLAALNDAADLTAHVAEIALGDDEAPKTPKSKLSGFSLSGPITFTVGDRSPVDLSPYLAPVPASPFPAGEATSAPSPAGVNVTDHAADGVAPGRCEARKGGWRCMFSPAGHLGAHWSSVVGSWSDPAVDPQEDDGDVCGVPV